MSKPEYEPPRTKLAALREKCRTYALKSEKLESQNSALTRKVAKLQQKVVQLESDLKSGAALMECEAALEKCQEELNEEIGTSGGLEEELEDKVTELAHTKRDLSGARSTIVELRTELADANRIIETAMLSDRQ
jgi:predicted  nucleic acid-binding Zn-ribbon protein